nr:hypothetical protein [Acinetobacter sp. Marseille-Q1620]
MKKIPIYSISNGVQSLVLNKLNEYSWQILHSEIKGVRKDFSDKDYSFLRKFRDSLQNLDPQLDIELKVQSLTITETIVETPIKKG